MSSKKTLPCITGTRFYHFEKSAFLLEIAGNYVKVTNLKTGEKLHSQTPAIIRRWKGMETDKNKVSATAARILAETAGETWRLN